MNQYCEAYNILSTSKLYPKLAKSVFKSRYAFDVQYYKYFTSFVCVTIILYILSFHLFFTGHIFSLTNNNFWFLSITALECWCVLKLWLVGFVIEKSLNVKWLVGVIKSYGVMVDGSLGPLRWGYNQKRIETCNW